MSNNNPRGGYVNTFMKEPDTKFYIESVSYRSFKELCDACRSQMKIGMSFGSPGIGKTSACFRYAHWPLVEANLRVRNGVPIEPEKLSVCDVLYFKPSITASPTRMRTEITILKNNFHDAKMRVLESSEEWAAARQAKQVDLIIIDEAHRLRYAALEEFRDLQEEWEAGMVLIGDPGMERALARMFHFSDRVRYIEKFEPLVEEEIVLYIDKQTEIMSLPKPPDEVYALISEYSRGNPRKLGHLFALIDRLLKINDDLVDSLTSEVVETARGMMLTRTGRLETLTELASAV